MRKRLSRLAYLTLGRGLAPLAPVLLKRRLAKGRELPARWREKLGEATLPRPGGGLIWLHAVGLGETMALRGLIRALGEQAPEAQFLITSGTRGSAEVILQELPPRARHQFMPLDFAPYLERFLDHWRPDLVIWSEQDIWPGAIFAAQARGIPQALVNARMGARSYRARARLASLYAAALDCLDLVDAQDPETASHLTRLGAKGVTVSGSLKPTAPPLAFDGQEAAELRNLLLGRQIWLAASSHPGDEAEILDSLAAHPGALVILAPRFLKRVPEIVADLDRRGLSYVQRSKGGRPGPQTQVWLADTLGEMGLWYTLADLALIGGGFDAVGGHNPWEAVILGCPVLHGPDTANFSTDYALLAASGAAHRVEKGGFADAVPSVGEAAKMAEQAQALLAGQRDKINALATRLLALLPLRKSQQP